MKKIGALSGIFLAVFIGLLTPPEGLTNLGMRGLGIVCGIIVFFIFDVLPGHCITLLMCSAFVASGAASFPQAFGSYAEPIWWLVVAAVGIGSVVGSCGLLKRLALLSMRLFPPTFNGMICAFLGTGTLFAPLMPSVSAKQSIIAPVAMEIGKILGFEKKSKGMAGLFSAMFFGYAVNAPTFLSASFVGYLLVGVLPEGARKDISWTSWLIGMLPWCAVLLVCSYFALVRIYAPREKIRISADSIDRQIKDLGPMSRDEKWTALVFCVTFCLWVTEGVHRVPAALTGLFCLLAMASLGLFSADDFQKKIPWGLLFYLGGILNIGTVLELHKIDIWLGGLAKEALGGLAAQPWVYVTALAVAVYLIRFVIVSYTTATVLLTIVLAPVAAESGIHPWVTGMIIYCSVTVWMAFYQCTTLLVGWAAARGEENLDFAHVRLGAWAYLAINIAALLASIPWWRMLGYIR